MPELQSHRESSTLPAHPVPIEGDHLFQAIPTTSSDGSEKVAAFRPEWVAAFRRNQWSPSRRNRWPLSPGKRRRKMSFTLPGKVHEAFLLGYVQGSSPGFEIYRRAALAAPVPTFRTPLAGGLGHGLS